MARRRRSVLGRLFRLILFVVVIFGGYTAAWLYVAGLAEGEVSKAVAEARREGREAKCENLRTDGFPLELQLSCDAIAYSEPPQGLAVKAGAFNAKGQIYDPMRVEAALAAPARIDVAGQPGIDLGWSSLRASTRLATPAPQQITLEGAGFSLNREGSALLSADSFRWEAVPAQDDLVLRCNFADLSLDATLTDGRPVPPLDGSCDFGIEDGMKLLDSDLHTLRGRSLSFRDLTITAGEGGGFSLSGWVKTDQQGLIDADVKLTPRNIKDLARTIATILPEHAETIDRYAQGLAAVSTDKPIPIAIKKGVVWLTLFRVAELPPVD